MGAFQGTVNGAVRIQMTRLSHTSYLTARQLSEVIKTVLREIRVKKADSHKVLNSVALDEIVYRVKTEGSDIHEKASILLIELTRRHPFASGVRRTATPPPGILGSQRQRCPCEV